jgi:hypothetical protein
VKQRNYVLMSVVALLLAVLAVMAAMIVRSRAGSVDVPPRRPVVVAPKATATGPDASATSPADEERSKRIRQHLSKARRHMKARNWQVALFFVDHALALDPSDAEAKRLLARVERQLTAHGGAVAVRAKRWNPGRRKPKANPVAKTEPVGEAELTITCQPSAFAFLDGNLLGKTPIEGVTVAAGKHTLKLEEEGYKRHVAQIELEPNKPRNVEIKLQALPKVYTPPPTRKPKKR